MVDQIVAFCDNFLRQCKYFLQLLTHVRPANLPTLFFLNLMLKNKEEVNLPELANVYERGRVRGVTIIVHEVNHGENMHMHHVSVKIVFILWSHLQFFSIA